MATPPPSLYAIEPRWLRADRAYLLYVTDRALCGARVAGQYLEAQRAAPVLAAAGGLAAPLLALALGRWARRADARRDARIARYAALDPLSPSFLRLDRANFRWRWADLAGVRLQERSRFARLWVWPLYPRPGLLTVARADGRRTRFIVPDGRALAPLRASLAGLLPESGGAR